MAEHNIIVDIIANTSQFDSAVNTSTANAGKKLSSVAHAAKQRLMYAGINAIIYGTIDAIKDMVDNVVELDKAQTELKKVSNLTGQSLENFTNQAYKMGTQVAKTGTEIVQASTEFVKMGNQPKVALQLSEYATRLQNIADTEISAADAAKFINSQLKAFGKTEGFDILSTKAEKAEYAIDAVNNVANQFGVGTNDLQAALTKVGAALSTTGNTFAQSIAMITAGTEVMPGQASKVGRGLRTIALTLAKTTQETDKLTTANGAVNISLKDTEGNTKNLYQVMQELYKGNKQGSKAWKDLNKDEQEAIGIALAGKTQYEVFSSIMENYGSAVKAAGEAEYDQAHGSSRKENERYLDSIEGKIANFQSAWEQLSYHVVNSDFLKGLIDTGTTLVKILDKLTTTIGGLPTLLTLIGTTVAAIRIPKALLGLLTAKAAGTTLGGLLGIGVGSAATTTTATVAGAEVAAGATAATGATGIRAAIKNYKELKKVAGKELTPVMADLGSEWVRTDEAVLKNNKAIEEARKSLFLLNGSFLTLGATIGLVGLAVGLKKLGDAMGLEGAIKDLKKTNSKLKETKDRIQELEDLGENRTDAEDRELGILQKELDVLEQQLERKKELVNLAYSNDAESKFEVEDGKLVTKSGLAGESTQTYTDLIASRKREYAKLQKEFDKALKNGNTAAMESIDSQMTILETTLKTAEDDVRDSYERLANVKYEEQSEIGKALFKDTISAYLQLVDNVDDYRGALEKLPENERVTLNFTDANGNPVSEDFSVGALLGLDEETLNMLINYTFNPEGNSEAFKEFLEQNPDGTAYQLFYDVLFQSEGEDEVEATKDTLTQDKTVDIRYNPITGQLEVVNADIDTTQPVQDVNYNPQTGKLSTLKQSLLQNPLTQYVNIVPRNTKKATGKRKGEQGGLSWLGDEGSAQNPKPELVVGEDGAYLAGTSGWELRALKSSDTVYTAAQTKKLLANNSFQGSVSELPRYAKGKNSINGKKTTAKKAKAKRDKLRESFDKDLETLEYKRGINEWADSTYIDKYQDLVDKYAKSLAKVVVNGNKQGLSTQQKRAFKEALHDANKKKAEKEIEKLADVVKYTGDTSAALAKAKKARDDKLLSAEEYKDYQKDIYKSALEYTQKEYEAGRETWSKLLQDAQNYWAVVDKDSKEYYESLEELRDSAIKTDENRLDYMDDYVSHQIEILQKQKEEEETEERIAELEQDIVDAENELAKARHTMVRTFKDGKWIYDVDQDAIRDAEQAVIDAKKALADEEGTELDKQIAQWEAIQDALDWTKKESEMREAGMVVGEGFIEELKALSMDPAVWADKAQILYNSILAMGQASGTSLEQILSDRAYATGTLSAPGGLSLVGEHGAELAWLGKGDSVYSNRLSSNLMQWGQYTPAQIISAAQGSGGQVFNFANLTLPNVKDANSFIKELQLLPNKAIQHSARR